MKLSKDFDNAERTNVLNKLDRLGCRGLYEI